MIKEKHFKTDFYKFLTLIVITVFLVSCGAATPKLAGVQNNGNKKWEKQAPSGTWTGLSTSEGKQLYATQASSIFGPFKSHQIDPQTGKTIQKRQSVSVSLIMAITKERYMTMEYYTTTKMISFLP